MDLSQLHLPTGTNLTLVVVQQGATNIQHVEHYHTQEADASDNPFGKAFELLDAMTNDLIRRGKGDAKSLLLPYYAAIRAAVIPKMDLDEFNRRYGLKVSSASFSEYTGINSKYNDADLEPYERHFLSLNNGTSGTLK